MAAISLIPLLHPGINMPIQTGHMKMSFTIRTTQVIGDLMDDVEKFFDRLFEVGGHAVVLSYNVIWNTKKTLSPNSMIGDHFSDGDIFGVYGDIMPKLPLPTLEKDKIPVVILTGFLGSGKTTLLNYMLSEQREKKIAVIENEFGEISIDDALLNKDKMALAEKVVVLDNGCMCCTIRGDLEKGLTSILDELKQGADIDLIAIETTGMADPVPIVRTFMSNARLTEQLRLDGVVTVADSKHLLERLDDEIEEGKVNEAYQQIAFADKIILNKLDLISAEQAIVVNDRIRDINKFAKILPAVKSRIKLGELAHMRAHDLCHFVDTNLEAEAAVAVELQVGRGGNRNEGHGDGHEHEVHGEGHTYNHVEDLGYVGDAYSSNEDGHTSAHGSGHTSGHGHVSKSSRHDKRVNSFSIVKEGEIIPRLFNFWMQDMCSLPPEKGKIYRVKAIFALKGFPRKKVFHAVMDASDQDDAGPWREDEQKVSKIVFIGKCMDESYFRDSFEAMFEESIPLKNNVDENMPRKKSRHIGPPQEASTTS